MFLAIVCLFLAIPLKVYALCDKTEFDELFFERRDLTHEMAGMVSLGRALTPEELNYFKALETKIYFIDQQLDFIGQQLDRECKSEQEIRDEKIEIHAQELNQARSEIELLEEERRQIEKEQRDLLRDRIEDAQNQQYLYCPPNSYLENNTCKCFDGYFTSNNQCIPKPTPALGVETVDPNTPESSPEKDGLMSLKERIKKISESKKQSTASSQIAISEPVATESAIEKTAPKKNILWRFVSFVASLWPF